MVSVKQTLLEHVFLFTVAAKELEIALSLPKKAYLFAALKKSSILISNYLIGGNIIAFVFLMLYNITIQLLLYNTSSVNGNKLLIITCKTNSKPHCI